MTSIRKTRCAFTTLIVMLAMGVTVFADVRETPGVVRVAAYNTENFFDVFDNPYTDDESADPKFHPEVEQLAQAIRTMDADVVGLVEVENIYVLQAMVQELLPDMGYDYIDVDQTNSGRGIQLGVISRLPILRTASYKHRQFEVPGYDQPLRMSRDVYQVTLDVDESQPLDVFLVHLKSKRDGPGDPQSLRRRTAEATLLRSIIETQLDTKPNAWIAALGDFNDTPDSEPIQRLLADDLLVDTHTHLPDKQRITYLHEPYRSTIDYILASPALSRRLVKDQTNIVRDESLLGGSDHAPVFATFDLRD